MRLRTTPELLPILLALSITACGDDVTSADTDGDSSSSTSSDDLTTDPETTATPTSMTDSGTTTGEESDADSDADSDDTESDSDTADTESDSDADSDSESDSDSDSDSDASSSTGEPEATTEIRVLHLSPNAPAVDVYVNGDETPAITDLPFTDGTAYVPLPPDTYTFDVAPTGTTIDDSVLTVEDLALDEGVRYSAVAYDFVEDITALALVDDESDIDAGETRFQISHTASGVPEVDIYELGSGGALIEGLDFGDTQTVDVPTGEYRLALDVNNDASPELLYVVPELPGGINVNVYAVFDGENAPFLLAHLPDGDTVRIDPSAFPGVRVVHLSPDAPNVDVYFNGSETPFLTDVPFTAGSAYFELLPGTFSFDVAPAGTSLADSVLQFTDLEFAPDTNYTAAAINEVGSIEGLALVDDVEGLAETDTRLQIVHAGPGVGEVDIINLADDGALVSDLAFGNAETIDVPTGAYTIGVDVDNDAEADLLFGVPELGGGVQVNVYATNDTDGDVFLLAHLPDGNIVRLDPLQTGIRVMHLSPDAPAVDVYVNGGATPAVEDLEFTDGTAYLSVLPGTYSFDVAPANTSLADSVLNVPALDIEAGVLYSAAAIDELASITALPLVDDVAGIPPGNTRLQIVHAGAGVGEVDVINLADDSALVSDISLGDAATLDVPSGAYQIGIDVNDDGGAELIFNVPELGPGVFANVYATNDEDGNVFLLAHLPDGTVAQIDPGDGSSCGGTEEGDLEGSDDTFNRPFLNGAGACALSASGTAVFYDVYTFSAEAGDTITASLCDAAEFDSVVAVYQAADGSADPFDPDSACTNLFAYSDDADGCGLTSEAATDPLVAGDYQVVVASFGNGTTGAYTLSVTCG